MIPYGDLMMMVDTRNRWVYKGSVTTPPCATLVYWNVLQKVYPIKQKHLDLFMKQLERTSVNLHKTGNWRAIQKTTPLHDLHLLQSSKLESPSHASTIIYLVFLLGVAIIGSLVMIMKLRSKLSAM